MNLFARHSFPVAALMAATFFVALFTAGGCSNLAENNLDSRVEQTLDLHPEGESIARWYGTLVPGSLEAEAAGWILAWLPDSDLAGLDPILLQEHVNLACETYRNAPWQERLPRSTWLHFVVPHRVSQEPLQPWRRVLQAELAPVVAPYDSMEEAALAVNRWCRQQATYIATSGRDMGPLTTLKRGLGRCEEEMILTICALRAVGIPARTCSTPYWTFTDDNHAWVEVWADGGWYYAESCDDRRCLNDAWFSESASRAGFVRSVGYGEFDPQPEPLYRIADGATIVNSTAVYTDPFRLQAMVQGHPETPVFVNVLNYGTLRAIARLNQGDNLMLGPGTFALTAEAPDDSGDLLLKTVTGQPGDDFNLVLDPELDRYDAEASDGFWLTYPEAASRPRRQEILVSDEVDRHHKLLVAADKADREKLRALDEDEQALLDALPTDLKTLWDEILTKPCESFSPLIRLLQWYTEPDSRRALTWLLADADDKDLLELNERAVRAHVDLSLAAREKYEGEMPDVVFRKGILASRIQREPGCDWRSDLPLVDSIESGPKALLATLLTDYAVDWEMSEAGSFGNPLPANQVYALGRGTKTDQQGAFVGLCRRNGLPARLRHGRVEVWMDRWQEVDPLPAEEDTDEPTAKPGPSGWVDIQLTRDGVPWAEAEGYRHFMVSRPGEGFLESPWWDPQLGVQEWGSGQYWFCATVRVPGGSAFGRLTRFEILPGDTTAVRLPVDLDPGGWDASKLVAAELNESLARIWPGISGQLPPAGLYLIFEPGEPATRMIPVVARLQDRLATRQLAIVPVMGPGEVGPWQEKISEAGLKTKVFQPHAPELFDWLAGPAQHGPVTLLILPGVNGDQPVFLRSGLDNAIDFSVHLALDAND